MMLGLAVVFAACEGSSSADDDLNGGTTTTPDEDEEEEEKVPINENFNFGDTLLWHFNGDMEGWEHGNQGDNLDQNFSEFVTDEDGTYIKIYTHPYTYERQKIRTLDKIYTSGLYEWRVYVPQMGEGDQASIGAFIYNDDTHELDFEIGYGKSTIRDELGISSSTKYMVAYTTSQANPAVSTYRKILTGWHTVGLDISVVYDLYVTKWLIDDVQVELQGHTNAFGPKDYMFKIFCSVENLAFLGDHEPYEMNYALFDYMMYAYHE